MVVPFVDRLVPVLLRGDVVAAWELLDSLAGDDLRAAKAWFAGNRRWLGNIYGLEYVGESHDEKFATYHNASWIVAMCAVALCGLMTAARRVPWTDLWDHQRYAGEAAFVQMLWDADRDWVAQFVETAGQVSLGGQARNVNANLSRVVRAAVVPHRLPCPTARTFLAEWSAGAGSG